MRVTGSLRTAIVRTALAALAAVVVIVTPTRARASDLPELAARAKTSVALITTYDAAHQLMGTGTGFFVTPNGWLVTNHHVIDGAVTSKVTLADAREIDVEGLIASDVAKDVVVLKVKGDGFTPLALGDSSALRVGDEIVVMGSPRGLSGTLSTGIVSAIRHDGPIDASRDDVHSLTSWGIQITAALSPGSSGSPIMTRGGEVIGVAVGVMTGGQALNFGVPVEVVKELLARAGAHPSIKPVGGAVEDRHVVRNLIISLLFFGLLGGGGWFLQRRADRAPRKRVTRH